MAGSDSYIQLPPDSTGKKIYTHEHTVGTDQVQIQAFNLADEVNPSYLASIDESGALFTRFAEGKPQLDAFGKLRVSQATMLGDYTFTNNILPYDFSTRIVGNANITHDPVLKCIKLACPSAVAPAVGSVDEVSSGDGTDLVAHTSNTYHHYFPSFSHTYTATVALGDSGKDNVVRAWGLFDADNGYGFKVDDSTSGLKIFIRSNVSGSVVETVVTQANFNKDVLDGTGSSGKVLNLQADNIYWIDIQWLGAGRIRFGTFFEGERIVVHEYNHDDNSGVPHAATASLPVCYVQKHVGTSSLNSEATMLAWCAAVTTDQTLDLRNMGKNSLETFTHTFDATNLANGQEYEFIGVLSPINIIADSPNANKTLYIPQYMEVLAYHTDDGADALVEVEVYANAIVGGGSQSFPVDGNVSGNPYLTPINSSPWCAVESYKAADGDAKFWGGGAHALATYVRGAQRADLSGIYSNIQDGAFKNFAENGGTMRHDITSVTTGTETFVNVSMVMHREGYPVRFTGITGTVGATLNYDPAVGNEYYIQVTANNQVKLWNDVLFTSPVDTSGLTYTSGGEMVGDYGQQLFFVVVCKPLGKTTLETGVTVHFNLGWKEIVQ